MSNKHLQVLSNCLNYPHSVLVPAVRVFGHSLGGVAALAAEVRQPGTFEAMHLFEPVIYDP
jgi:pimeloyl-ACP methyl ester carboxylesterase